MTAEADERAMVVREARSWIKTPYVHAGQIKGLGGGCDCGTLLIGVYSNVGFIDYFTPEPYQRDFMMHNNQENYLAIVLARAREIDEALAGPGDVVLWKMGRLFAHGAIINDGGWDHIIHAFSEVGHVTMDHGLGGRWGNRPRRFFSYWGK